MKTLPLHGEWKVRQEAGRIRCKGQVPGCIHADLLRAGLIENPDWRTNEHSLVWIGESFWTYERDFTAGKLPVEEHVELVAEGLDTLATIWFNDRLVGRTDNMHRTWRFDIRRLLRRGRNKLRITFDPVRPYLEKKGRIDPLPAWNEYHGWKHRGWLRKQHSNFGWDWSPVLVSCGVWMPIRLEAWSANRFDTVRIAQTHRKADVELALDCGLATTSPARIEGSVWHDGNQVGMFSDGKCTLRRPRLWWPSGMGEQPLYQIRLQLLDSDGRVLDSWTRRFGLRTLQLIRKKDRWGISFHFEANGVPFFAKGPNWINPLPYPSYPEDGSWRQALRDAVAVHCNMIRVWGGANYCPDDFYDLCDELGLTVWQDLLFACGPYPADDAAFLTSVAAETVDNVRRLRHHPCIALWCGNNELEHQFIAPKKEPGKMAYKDYDYLFENVLGRSVRNADPQASYWPASPVFTLPGRDGVDAGNGDIHIWEIWFSDAPFENYRNYPHRFISEFGFQSMPHPRTLESFTLPEDRQFNSPVLEHHQRSGPGNIQIIKHLNHWFRFPRRLDHMVLLSQLVQANSLKIGVEHFRRNMPRTMGTLYWQLNDCWPAPTWSTIDSAGRWKAGHFFARRFFSPILVSACENPETRRLEVWLTHDTPEPRHGLLRLTITDLDGKELETRELRAKVPGRSSRRLLAHTLPPGLRLENCLAWLDWIEEEKTLVSNTVLWTRPKQMELQNPDFQITVRPDGRDGFEATVQVRRPALWAWLDIEGVDCRWSDNFQCVRPGTPWIVHARPATPMRLEEFRRTLRVESVRSTWAET